MRHFSRILVFLPLSIILAFAPAVQAQFQQFAPANWALDRLDQRSAPFSSTYGYTTTGAGVHIYVIDSGIRADHAEFAGRVTINADYVDGPTGTGQDCRGHGTAVAGIAAGTTYGVAKGAQIHVLKVLGCRPLPDETQAQAEARMTEEANRIIQALWWIQWNHIKPAVVNISANYAAHPSSSELAIRIKGVLDAGVVVVASAGNAPGPIEYMWLANSTECNSLNLGPNCFCDYYYGCPQVSERRHYNLPPEVPGVIKVGATNFFSQGGKWDHRVKNTHWGVDVYAPGWYLKTASTESSTASQFFYETSAAAPVVTGVVARYLQSHPTATPAQVRSWVMFNATKQIVGHVPPWEAGFVYMAPTE